MAIYVQICAKKKHTHMKKKPQSRSKWDWETCDLTNLIATGCRLLGLSRLILVVKARLILPLRSSEDNNDCTNNSTLPLWLNPQEMHIKTARYWNHWETQALYYDKEEPIYFRLDVGGEKFAIKCHTKITG